MPLDSLGIDLAKNVFQLHGVNASGRVVLKRHVMRDQLLEVVAQTQPCTTVVEACAGAFACPGSSRRSGTAKIIARHM